MTVLLAACSVEPLDLDGRECPCVTGWVCDEARNVCVQMDGGASDSGVPDTGPGIDSSADAGPDGDAAADAAGDGGDGGDDAAIDPSIPPDPTSCDDVYADALFCDGFEGDLSSFDGVREPRGSTVTIVGDPVYRGTGALRAEALPGGTSGGGAYVEVFPIVAGPSDQWARAYVYVQANEDWPFEIHRMRETSGAYDFVTYFSGSKSNLHTHSLDPGAAFDNTMAVLPLGEWVCVETHVRLNDADTGLVELYLDGVPVISETVDSTVTRGMSEVTAGISWHDMDTTSVVYLDEFVADDEQIGCD